MTSVFSNQFNEVFSTYQVAIKFRDKLLGGIPKDPAIIEGWLRSKAGISDETEVKAKMKQVLDEVSGMPNRDDWVAASEAVATEKHTCGFKCDESGLYIEDRQIKAMLKESVNILFAGQPWGKTRKGPKNFTAERVFVSPQRITLGRVEPDGIETLIKHVDSRQGPLSSIARHEYVEGGEIKFNVMVANDDIKPDHWPMIWTHAQENGLGTARSQSFGRFDVTEWKKVA